MELLIRFALDLLKSGTPGLALIVIVAVCIYYVSPITLTLRIGDRSNRPHRSPKRPKNRAHYDEWATCALPQQPQRKPTAPRLPRQSSLPTTPNPLDGHDTNAEE